MPRWEWSVGLGLLLFGGVSSGGTPSNVAPAPSPRLAPAPSSLRTEAALAEREGRWEDALDVYLRLYSNGRPSADIRDRIRVCLRHASRLRRHREPAFQQYVLTLKPAQALDLYAEVIERLGTLYADRERCTPARLFALGLTELERTLGDASFRQRHLDGIVDARTQRFRESLRQDWHQRLPGTVAETRTAAFELVREARDQLSVRNGSAIVLELLCGACTGLDEFTVYVAPTGNQADLATPISELAEYGLLVRLFGAALVVDGVIAGSWAAHHTPLHRGDRITRVNGRLLDSEDPASLAIALRAPGMFGHDLEVASDMGAHEVVRLPVPMPTVFGVEMVADKDGVGYLRLAAIRDTTPRELDDAILSLKARGARVLVVDVRGNSGGNFLAGIQIAQRFLPGGIIVTTQGQSPEFANRVFSSDSGMAAYDLPVVLLVDTRTMSAAEAVAAAWKDHNRAILVGLPTFGKGAVQGQIRLGAIDGVDGARSGVLILTLAHMVGPRGVAVGAGVVPHILVADPTRQLELAIAKAVELAGGMR